MRRKKAETDFEFSFWFSVVVLTYLFSGFVSTAARLVWDPLSALQLSAIFLLPYLVFNWLSFRRLQLPNDSFSVSYLTPTALTAFSFEFLSANHNSLSICCWYVSTLTRVSLITLQYDKVLNKSIEPIDGTLTGITTPGQSGSLNEGHFTQAKFPELNPQHQMYFSIFWVSPTSLYKVKRHHVMKLYIYIYIRWC